VGLYDGILDYITSAIDGLSLYASTNIGALPDANGISVYLGPGATDRTFLDKGAEGFVYVVVNAKHTAQLTALQALDSIHDYLTKLKSYQITDDYQIINIETNSAPSYIGAEEHGGFLYGSILKVTFFNKGVS
jgi:hypothetical protein